MNESSRGFSIAYTARGGFVASYKTKDGKWLSKRIPKSIQNQVTAEAWFSNQYKYYLKFGFFPNIEIKKQNSANRRLTMRLLKTEVFDYWANRKLKRKSTERIDPDTVTHWKCDFENWVSPHSISNIDVAEDLKAADVRQWIEWICNQKSKRDGERLGANSINNIIQAASTFIADAVNLGHLPENFISPFDLRTVKDIIPKRKTKAGEDIIHLNQEEIIQLLSCSIVPPNRLVRYFLEMNTGARDDELDGLSFESLMLSAPVPYISFRRQLVKPGDDPTFKPLKGGKRRKDIPIHPKTLVALKWWIETGWESYVGREPNVDDPIFPNAVGSYSRPDSADSLRSDLRKANLRDSYMGLHPHTFHGMRRSYLTWLEDVGVEASIRRALAGHSGHGVAELHYEAKSMLKLRSAVERLPLPDFPLLSRSPLMLVSSREGSAVGRMEGNVPSLVGNGK